MTIADFLSHFGYLAVLVGTFLEGETILIMAGFAAHGGYLNLYAVVAIATLGSFAGDQLYFFLGRRHGWEILERYPHFKPRAIKVQALLDRYHLPLILAIRFMYGLRIAGPIVIGMSSVAWARFFALNLLGATLWAILIGGTGYLFGQVMEQVLADLKHYEEGFLALIALAGIAVWLRYRTKRKAENGK
jgi:membrane protein DedA with SNARE-associated domain